VSVSVIVGAIVLAIFVDGILILTWILSRLSHHVLMSETKRFAEDELPLALHRLSPQPLDDDYYYAMRRYASTLYHLLEDNNFLARNYSNITTLLISTISLQIGIVLLYLPITFSFYVGVYIVSASVTIIFWTVAELSEDSLKRTELPAVHDDITTILDITIKDFPRAAEPSARRVSARRAGASTEDQPEGFPVAQGTSRAAPPRS
jgi:hypothetical protein